MRSEAIEKALNDQINAELYSAYLYYAMAAYFDSINLVGFASWMKIQVQEELAHVQKFYDFINERNGRVNLGAVDQPALEWETPLTAFEAAYNHEVMVSGLINDLVDLSIKESDHATNNFLQWFVSEQVEEEATADDIVNKLNMVGGQGAGMFMLDQEMAGRVFVPPTPAQA